MKNSICILLFFLIAFVACNEDEGLINPEDNQSLNEADLKSADKKDKVSVYHYDKDTDSWHVITISPNALPAHLAQGGYLATYVPDDNFEQALVDLGYDTPPLDDYVPTGNINTVTNLSIISLNIGDLTGIEDFTSLAEIDCSGNQLSTLDFSNNTALTGLWCHDNQLTNLDVTINTALEWLICAENQLTTLDVSNNPKLFVLNFYNNQLTNIDVSNNPDIIEIECQGNNLTSLDVSSVTALTALLCYDNKLTSLDVTNLTALTLLWCQENPNLFCIQVISTTPVPFTYEKDSWTSFSLDCGY